MSWAGDDKRAWQRRETHRPEMGGQESGWEAVDPRVVIVT